MYSVMLVDDDYPVLELLSEMIAWEELGLQLAGIYENGYDAWNAAQQSMPDILVTDIGMPKMNGLELIRELKGERRELKVVILSCHSEFHYAREAMQLQVQDYIVKDTLDPDDLQRIMQRFAYSLAEEKRYHDEQKQMRLLINRSRDALKTKWLQSAVQQPYWNADEWKRELNALGLALDDKQGVIAAIGRLVDYRTAKQRFHSEHSLSFAVTNVLEEALQVTSYANELLLIPSRQNEWVLLYSCSSCLKVNAYDLLRNGLLKLQQAIKGSLKLSINFVIGSLCDLNTTGLKQSLNQLMEDRYCHFYMQPASIASLRSLTTQPNDIFAVYDKACQQFSECIIKRDHRQLLQLIQWWIDHIAAERYEPENVKDWLLKLVLDIRLKQHSRTYFRAAQTVEYLHQEVNELGSLTEIHKWLLEHMELMLNVEEEQARSQRKEVMDAYQFVEAHMDQRIGLEDIAEYLHLNASYFSRLFKKETGETFIEYVIRTKMKRAKELLDQTTLSVTAICEQLGYDNPSYFNKLFKSCHGITPTEYRHKR